MSYFNYQSKKIYYKETGSGKPIVFLHGNTASSRMFELILPLYEDKFHVILIDFLGHGKSDRLEEFPADRIILSSCQGCLGSFKGQGRETLHLLELLFGKSRKQGWKNRIFVTLCPGIVLRSR